MKVCNRRKCIFFLIVYTVCLLVIFYKYKTESYNVKNCEDLNIPTLKHYDTFKKKVEKNLQTIYFQKKHALKNLNKTQSGNWVQLMDDVYVYSAYIDACKSVQSLSSPFCVKFIGATFSNRNGLNASVSPIKCAFKNKLGVISKIGFAVLEKIEEDHDKMYTAAFFFCSLQEVDDKLWPKYASLFGDSENKITWLPVNSQNQNFSSQEGSIRFNVCVRPFYGSLSSVSLSEFIAYYSIMGTDHFVFYRTNTSETIDSFFTLINIFNISIEMLEWDLPLDNEIIHEYGQIVFTQDCIARSRFVFTHTLIVDVDEFVVPKQHKNFKMLVADLDNKYVNAGSYVIHMALFCYEFPVENVTSLSILTHSRRQKTVWDYWYRSKYIVKPERVYHAGIHFVWTYEPGMKEVRLPASVALLHHYKICCGVQQTWFLHLLSFNVLDDKVIEDKSLIRFHNNITNHILIKFILKPMLYLV